MYGLGITMVAVHGNIRTDFRASKAAPMVIRAAERHGRGGSPLRRDRQHQQPNEKRSDQQAHSQTLPHALFATAACPSCNPFAQTDFWL
jgi:hypothetical protein